MTNFRTAETVSPGHPDKIADLISDHVLTNALKTNKKSKVAVETFLTGTKEGGLVVVGGEISDIAEITDDKVNAIVKDALSKTIKTSFEDLVKIMVKSDMELVEREDKIRKEFD